MDVEEKLAFIVLVNANSAESPWQYANHMRTIFLKGEKEKQAPVTVNLDQFTGNYNGQPYESEKRVLSWYGHLALVNLPSRNPLEEMTLLQHIQGDVFRRIRRDDSLGEEVLFERDPITGKVTKMWAHSNYSLKLK